jgi:glycosyltransferase involved in cell wall biosynthesis
VRRVTPLLLGMGWFPDQENGVNRYFRSLLEALGSPPAVVIGPAADAPPSVSVVERHEDPAWRRMIAFTAAARRRAREADVIDTHFAMYAVAPVLLGLRGKPLVVHFQGPWGAESLSARQSLRPKAAARWMLERVVYRRAAATIVLSHAFKRLLVERYGVRPETVHVVRPGVDLHRFSPGDRDAARRGLHLPRDRPIAVTARRLVPRMGLDVLLEAWGRVGAAAEGARRPLLVVVGDGEQRPALEAQTRRLGLERDVRFLGKVSDGDLVAAYRAADVAVAPSVSLEGFGLVVLEALACGTPVVGTSAEGLREALEELDPTLLVPPGDAEALAARLSGMLVGDEPTPSGPQCRAYAEGFTWERTAREVEAIYRTAASVAESG